MFSAVWLSIGPLFSQSPCWHSRAVTEWSLATALAELRHKARCSLFPTLGLCDLKRLWSRSGGLSLCTWQRWSTQRLTRLTHGVHRTHLQAHSTNVYKYTALICIYICHFSVLRFKIWSYEDLCPDIKEYFRCTLNPMPSLVSGAAQLLHRGEGGCDISITIDFEP